MNLLFLCQMPWICLQDDPTLWLLLFKGNYLWCYQFYALFYTHQSLCMIECWKTSNCQHLNVSFVPHSISSFRILKNQKHFTKIVQSFRFNACFRGVLASLYGQQLHILEASVKLLLVFTFWVMPSRTKLGITTHLLRFNPWRNVASIQPLLIIDAWSTNETYQQRPFF